MRKILLAALLALFAAPPAHAQSAGYRIQPGDQLAITVLEDESRLKEERAALQKAFEDFGGIVAAMFAQLMSGQEDVRNVYKVGQNTTRLLLSVGDLALGYLLLRQASVALGKLDGEVASDADRAFYEGKLAVARFFAHTVLPELTARRAVLESIDNNLMDVAEESF